uniref:(northern house mosquito) hypothetical protein n=1 Tax=Culex pipiens TaxID=7175 RepID=A0A8D8G5S1_CULPI
MGGYPFCVLFQGSQEPGGLSLFHSSKDLWLGGPRVSRLPVGCFVAFTVFPGTPEEPGGVPCSTCRDVWSGGPRDLRARQWIISVQAVWCSGGRGEASSRPPGRY